MRLYYNQDFAGEAPSYEDDYMEDNTDNVHIIGKTFEGDFYRGFIADMYYRNFATTVFTSLTQVGDGLCDTCLSCPVTQEFYECCEPKDG